MKDLKTLIEDLYELIKSNDKAQKTAIGFAYVGAVMLICGSRIAKLILNGFNPALASSILVPIIVLAMSCIYGYILCVSTFTSLYNIKTGRNYISDHHRYKRSYFSLVRFFEDAEPHKLDLKQFPECEWQSYHGLIFGKSGSRLIAVPSTTEGNIAVFGPPGSGKTAGLAIINACQFNGSVLAIDVKGDIYHYVHRHTTRTILRFAPDARNATKISMHFDPMAGVSRMDETDRRLYVEMMASVLIPDEGRTENNYFTSRARKIFQGIVFLLLDKDPSTDFPTIIHAILEGNVFNWVTAAVNGSCRLAKELLASFYGNNEKNLSGAYDALTSALIHYSNPILDVLLSPKGGHCISNADLEAGADIYLQISQENLDTYASLFTLVIQQMSVGFSKRPDSSSGKKNRPILVIADELPALSFSYELLNRNISTLRSKGVIFMLISQNLSQLDYKYQPTGERSIIGNCNYQLILGCNDPNSEQEFSNLFGQKKVLHKGNSESFNSRTVSISEAYESIYPPAYFGDLPAHKSAILYFKGKHAEIEKLNCYEETIG